MADIFLAYTKEDRKGAKAIPDSKVLKTPDNSPTYLHHRPNFCT
jgi:hypothetical protein